MNTEFFEAVRPAAERVGWVLVHSTWQGVAIAAALWVMLAVMGKRSAARRYVAGCVALAAVVVAMAVTFARVEGTRRVAPVAGRASLPTAVDLRVGDAPVPAVAGVAQDEPKPAADAPSWDVKRQIAPWLPVVVGAWVIGVAGLAVWHFGGWVRVRRMTRAGAAEAWEERVGRLALRLGVSKAVRVVESALAGVPAVVGFVRPVILLPAGLAAEMSAAQVEAILLHELAHVRRNDYLVNLVQTAVETLLFYHPAVWWISGQIRQEREHCCDDLAVAACGDRAGYARALARVEEIRGATLPLAAAADGGSLLQRVRRIAGSEPSRRRRVAPTAAMLAAVVSVVAVMIAAEWSAKAADHISAAATRPATTQAALEEQWNGIRVSPVTPGDLVPTEVEYKIAENDLLTVTIGETVLSRRVAESGSIKLPQIGDVPVVGKTEAALGRSLADALRKKGAGDDMRVSVRVTEARGNMFTIYGTGVSRAGQYPITRPDYRLSEALAVAGVAGKQAVVRVIRGQGNEHRAVTAPVAAVLAGNPKFNLVVRHGDALFVDDPDRRFVHVVVGPDTITFDGKAMDLAGVEQALREIPAEQRDRAGISVWAESDDVSVGRLMWVFNTCNFEARRLGMPDAQNRGVQSGMKRMATTQPATKPAEVVGTFYIGGRVHQPGVYGIDAGGTTLARALASAGVSAAGPAFITIVRRTGNRQAFPVDGVSLREVLDGPAGRIVICSEDRVVVSGEKPSDVDRATEIRPALHVGEPGEVYIGGHVRQPGIYSVSGRKVTIAQAIIWALGPDNGVADATEVRRREPGHETIVRVSLSRVLDGTESDLYLQPYDEINVGVLAPLGPAGK